MKLLISALMFVSINTYAHDIEDKDLLESCLKMSTLLKQVCTAPKEKAKSTKEAYQADRSLPNLKAMLSAQKDLVKCYTTFNIACVASLKTSLNDEVIENTSY
jgi:hypothetical protein